MEFAYIKKLKPFIILSMILIFIPTVTKAGGIIPTDFNGFAVTSDEIVVVGDNTAVTGWKNNKEVFSFKLAFKTDYAISVNQDDNIVIYTENAKFIFAQDGTPLTCEDNISINVEEIKNRKIINHSNGSVYYLTNRFGVSNTITKIENQEQTTVYKTPSSVLLAEIAFWEGNLILVCSFIAGLLDVKKRRFSSDSKKNIENEGFSQNETAKNPKPELPAFLKAFKKPEVYNKGAAFSSEYSSKPGERQRFLENTADSDNSETQKTKEETLTTDN